MKWLLMVNATPFPMLYGRASKEEAAKGPHHPVGVVQRYLPLDHAYAESVVARLREDGFEFTLSEVDVNDNTLAWTEEVQPLPLEMTQQDESVDSEPTTLRTSPSPACPTLADGLPAAIERAAMESVRTKTIQTTTRATIRVERAAGDENVLFVVIDGRYVALTTSDAARLAFVLREIAGTPVYELSDQEVSDIIVDNRIPIWVEHRWLYHPERECTGDACATQASAERLAHVRRAREGESGIDHVADPHVAENSTTSPILTSRRTRHD